MVFSPLFTARRYCVTAVFAVARCLSVRLSVCLSGMGSRQFCRGRGREVEAEARQGSMSLTEARQGRGRELEAEARQTKFEARPRRGDPLKKPSFPDV